MKPVLKGNIAWLKQSLAPLSRCLISSAISRDSSDILSALYIVPDSLLLSTAAIISRALAGLNLIESSQNRFDHCYTSHQKTGMQHKYGMAYSTALTC